MNQFIIPENLFSAIAPVKQNALKAIYGIGVKLAVVKQQKSSLKEGEDYDISQDVIDYNPDAAPSINGGYRRTSGWSGEMSSSLIGMPVMCYIKFIGKTYIDLLGNEIVVPDVTFETVIITTSLEKDIKKTSIVGGNYGTVKEYIGRGDYSVEIRAIVTADVPVNKNIQKRQQSGVYPRENMQAIFDLVNAPVSIEIDCWYLNNMGITHLVINSGVDISQVEGEYSMQRVVLPCLSDNPLIIKTA